MTFYKKRASGLYPEPFFHINIDIQIIAKTLEEAKKKVEELFNNEENKKFTYVINETN